MTERLYMRAHNLTACRNHGKILANERVQISPNSPCDILSLLNPLITLPKIIILSQFSSILFYPAHTVSSPPPIILCSSIFNLS